MAPPGTITKLPLPVMPGVIALARLFVIVTICDALAVATVCVANVSVVGAKISGSTAVPFTLRTCCPRVPLSVKVTEPLTAPVAASEGVKVTEIAQLFPAARLPLIEQGVAPVPAALKNVEAENDDRVTALALTFLTVTTLPALLVPCGWLANVRLVGLNVSGAAPPPVPVPDKPTT